MTETTIEGKNVYGTTSTAVLEHSHAPSEGFAYISLTNGSDFTHMFFSREELKKLIEAAQVIYDDYKPILPKADAYKGYSTIYGREVYFAELPHKPGFYSGGTTGDDAVDNAITAARKSSGGIELKYWTEMYGPKITPVYLTKREIVSTVTDVTEGDPVTF